MFAAVYLKCSVHFGVFCIALALVECNILLQRERSSMTNAVNIVHNHSTQSEKLKEKLDFSFGKRLVKTG